MGGAMGEDNSWFEEPIKEILIKKKPLEEYSPKELDDIYENIAKTALLSIKSNASTTLKENRKIETRFKDHLWNEWMPAFDLFQVFLESCLEIGKEFHENTKVGLSEDERYSFSALTRLHARGCQIGFEIFTLLTNGYPDGALARWRTLHEISITAMFITENGNSAAKSYLSHDIVEQHGIDEYQSFCRTYYGFNPFTEEELKKRKEARKKMRELFAQYFNDYLSSADIESAQKAKGKDLGKIFEGSYGWAWDILHKQNIISKVEPPRVKHIEKAIKYESLSEYYKLAHNSVHAGSKALYFKLGVPKEFRDETILAGPSDIGFTDPAQCAVRSLYILTIAIVMLRPSIYRMVLLKILDLLVIDITDAFFKIDNRLQNLK